VVLAASPRQACRSLAIRCLQRLRPASRQLTRPRREASPSETLPSSTPSERPCSLGPRGVPRLRWPQEGWRLAARSVTSGHRLARAWPGPGGRGARPIRAASPWDEASPLGSRHHETLAPAWIGPRSRRSKCEGTQQRRVAHGSSCRPWLGVNWVFYTKP